MTEREIAKIVKVILSEQISIKITLDIANALIEKVRQKAIEMNVNVVIAVADNSGNPIAVQCMDEAYIASFDIAVHKAFTSVGLKMSTHQLGILSQPNQPLYGIQYTNDGKIVIFGGGEPLRINEKIIGAIGVSGGSVEQDTALAAFGKEVFKEVAAWQ
jgi:Uncharacterized protein, possibly involved in utilization of glycolate and propanediol